MFPAGVRSGQDGGSRLVVVVVEEVVVVVLMMTMFGSGGGGCFKEDEVRQWDFPNMLCSRQTAVSCIRTWDKLNPWAEVTGMLLVPVRMWFVVLCKGRRHTKPPLRPHTVRTTACAAPATASRTPLCPQQHHHHSSVQGINHPASNTRHAKNLVPEETTPQTGAELRMTWVAIPWRREELAKVNHIHISGIPQRGGLASGALRQTARSPHLTTTRARRRRDTVYE